MENFLGGFIGTVGFLILILIFKNLAEYIKKKIFAKDYNSTVKSVDNKHKSIIKIYNDGSVEKKIIIE
jgi:hypothetical protein